jgi:pimeloyl-ACP methyl ester carboxylesterase
VSFASQILATSSSPYSKMSTSSIQPYSISVASSRIDTLNSKLDSSIFPDELESSGWDMGTPLADIQRLAKFWRRDFSWRKVEEQLNKLPQFTTSIQCKGYEALNIHFLHKRSSVKGAIPLLFVHGWPGNFLEVTKIIDQLASDSKDQVSFHVVAPSLPNFGFSDGTKKRGFSMEQYAETLHTLMLRLGYDQYVTQGGDWGWYVTRAISMLYPQHCRATHYNMDVGRPPTLTSHPWLYLTTTLNPFHRATERERSGAKRTAWFDDESFGYNLLQSTKPQTLGYLLQDSPIGLLAWIYEKLHDWSDDYSWTDEEICAWVSIYWFSNAGPAAAQRIYYEIGRSGPWGERMNRDKMWNWLPDVKIGYSHFPKDIHVLPSSSTRTIGNVVFEREHASGGHFAAWERPDELVQDVRDMFGRGGGAFQVIMGKSGYHQ